MTPVKRTCLGCAVLIALPPLALVVMGVWQQLALHWSFSPLKWRIARESSRAAMARDYLSSRQVVGMTLDQVRADLGEPTWEWDYWEYAVSFAGLGPAWPGSAPRYSDEKVMIVWFHESGRRVSDITGPDVEAPMLPAPFSPEAWQSYAHFPDLRRPLAYDLIHGRQLRGATRDEVKSALGEPDFGEMLMQYVVEQGGSDATCLALSLDAGDRVVSAAIR